MTEKATSSDGLANTPWWHRGSAWILAAIVVVTFWPALLGQYVADDLRLIEQDKRFLSGDLWALLGQPMFGTEGGYWRPLTMLVLFVGHTTGGAFAVHLGALTLHLLNTATVRTLALRVTTPMHALWAAAFFAVHPSQVESLSWCSAINDPLWVFAALQAVRAALRWREQR